MTQTFDIEHSCLRALLPSSTLAFWAVGVPSASDRPLKSCLDLFRWAPNNDCRIDSAQSSLNVHSSGCHGLRLSLLLRRLRWLRIFRLGQIVNIEDDSNL